MPRFLQIAHRFARIGWGLAIRFVLALLVPPRCAACDEILRKRSIFCATCAATVEPASAEQGAARFRYGGALKTAITRFKYGDRADLAEPLGQLLLRGLVEAVDDQPRVIVPVPLHPARLADRGFNQVVLLARVAARGLGWRLEARALARTRVTSAQASLGAEERAANVADAFRARNPSWLRGRDVLLLDDVTTTGSTLRACRIALERAGARSVTCFALAMQELEPGSRRTDRISRRRDVRCEDDTAR